MSDLGAAPADRSSVREVDLDRSSALALAGFFLALVAIRQVAHSTPRTLTWLSLAALLALAVNPLVIRIQHRLGVGRGAAVSVVVLGVIVVITATIAVLAPPAIRQAGHLNSEVPRVTRQLGELPIVGRRLRANHVPANARAWLQQLPARLTTDPRGIGREGRRLAGDAASVAITLLLALTLAFDGERLVNHARRFLPPRRRQEADRLARLAYGVVGRYIAGSLLVAAISGIAVLVVGLVLGVPLTPLVAVWVGAFELVPQIGGAIGGVPFVLLGFTRSATTGVACGAIYVVYLFVKNHVLSPLIIGRAVRLSPLATLIAALVGLASAGVIGGVIAVPAVGATKAVYLELRGAAAPPP